MLMRSKLILIYWLKLRKISNVFFAPAKLTSVCRCWLSDHFYNAQLTTYV